MGKSVGIARARLVLLSNLTTTAHSNGNPVGNLLPQHRATNKVCSVANFPCYLSCIPAFLHSFSRLDRLRLSAAECRVHPFGCGYAVILFGGDHSDTIETSRRACGRLVRFSQVLDTLASASAVICAPLNHRSGDFGDFLNQ